ncbi:MAG TPA: hypothetical protein VE134_05390, partial [Methanomicrobiales archaeon]|nr:hypothetical protein [Methanomicrobiales archaeon]
MWSGRKRGDAQGTSRRYLPLSCCILIALMLALSGLLPSLPALDALHNQQTVPEDPLTLPEYNPVIGQMLLQVNESALYATTHDLQGFGTRRYGTYGNRDAALYLEQRLSEIPGLQVE